MPGGTGSGHRMLVPDPLTQLTDDSGQIVTNAEFAKAVREVIGTIGGRTLVLGFVDLSCWATGRRTSPG